MPEKIRLKGRSLLVGAVPLSCLSVSVLIMMTVALSFLPLIYINILQPYLSNKLGDVSVYISLISSVFIVTIIYLLLSSFKVGCDRYMLKKAQNIHADTRDIFYYFKLKSFFKLAFFCVKLSFVKLITLLFLNIPTILCLMLLIYLSSSPSSAAVSFILAVGCITFAINAIVFYSRLSSTLFLVRYYFIMGEYINFRHLLSSSQNAMRGKEKELIKLKRSFVGWLFFCAFIIPIGYVFGYYNQTLAAYASEIIKLQ